MFLFLFKGILQRQFDGVAERRYGGQCGGGVCHDAVRRGEHTSVQPARGPLGQGEQAVNFVSSYGVSFSLKRDIIPPGVSVISRYKPL